MTALYEINRIINKREEELAKEIDNELIERLFFIIYLAYKDIYLKAALDKLPLY